MAAAARNQYVTAGEARMTSTLQGGERAPYQVRFVVPENLAPTTRAHHPNAGHLTKYDYPIPPPRPGNRYNGGKPTITLPDLPRVLKDAHAPLNGDDIVMETIGSEHLEKEVGELLSRVGVDPDKTGDITWVVTGTEMLTGAQVRGPSSITATMVGQGIIKDENTVIRIEGFPVSSVQTPQDLTTLRMDVAEGGANVSGSHGSSTDSGYKASVNFGALAGEHDGSQQVFPGLNRAGDIPGLPRSASSRTTALGPVLRPPDPGHRALPPAPGGHGVPHHGRQPGQEHGDLRRTACGGECHQGHPRYPLPAVERRPRRPARPEHQRCDRRSTRQQAHADPYGAGSGRVHERPEAAPGRHRQDHPHLCGDAARPRRRR